MTYTKFNLAVEAKKVIKGKTTKETSAVLLYLFADEYLRTNKRLTPPLVCNLVGVIQ